METKVVNDSEFEKIISSNKKVMVKFYADWCGVCKRFAPVYKNLSNDDKYKDITFIEVAAEHTPKARITAGVYSLPYFATFDNGNIKDKVSSDNKSKVEALLNDLITL